MAQFALAGLLPGVGESPQESRWWAESIVGFSCPVCARDRLVRMRINDVQANRPSRRMAYLPNGFGESYARHRSRRNQACLYGESRLPVTIGPARWAALAAPSANVWLASRTLEM